MIIPYERQDAELDENDKIITDWPEGKDGKRWYSIRNMVLRGALLS